MASIFFSVIKGAAAVVAERTATNAPSSASSLPVLPHELVRLSGREFAAVVAGQKERLSAIWSAATVGKIEDEFAELRESYRGDANVSTSLDGCSDSIEFEDAWGMDCVANQYQTLRDFCGGLASIFPNVGTTESDFSLLRWEKDDHRKSLTDFSLEGVLQCKGHKALREAYSML